MTLRFGPFELDPARHLFLRDGEAIRLEPQVFDLIHLFASRPGQLVTTDEIMDVVWNGRIVSDATVSSRINAVRRALGDDGKRQDVLETIPRRGFRLIAPESAQSATEQARPAPAVHMTRSADGCLLAYSRSGTGPPLLRAGHFLTHLEQDWTSPLWRPLIDRLGQSHSVIRYDQRGTGLSDDAPPSLSLEGFVADLEAVADAAGAERFPIFAASQGVPVAIAFAARFPERVSRLVLYGGFARGRLVRADAAERRKAEAALTMIEEGWGRHGSAFAAAFATLYIPDAGADLVQHLSTLQRASATPQNAIALRRAVDEIDVSEVLGAVQAPTLILHMRDDAVQPVSEARDLAAGIPGAELRIIDGLNHVPVPGRAGWDEMVEATARFLAEDSASDLRA